MKRAFLALALCLIVIPVVTFAQGEPGSNRMSLGANFELSVPVGDFTSVAGTGYGGNLRYLFGMDSRTVFSGSVGYLVWGTKDLGGSASVQTKAFNFLLGGKYYPANGFYVSLEGGLYFFTFSYTGGIIGTQGNTARFTLPIGFGYQKSGFELGARYMLGGVNFNFFSFTLGYNFML